MFEQTVLAKVAAWFSTLIPAIIGAAISMKFSEINSSYVSRIFSFIGGVALAHYVGGTIVEHWQISADSLLDDSIVLVSGIFGMATVAEINRQIPEIIRSFFDRIKTFINK